MKNIKISFHRNILILNVLWRHFNLSYLSVFLFDEVDEKDDHAEGVEGQDDGDVDARGVWRLLVHVLQDVVIVKLTFAEDKTRQIVNDLIISGW